ncbi:uncharacterized protein BKCO1_1000397 [Diplodia corticola]|uniref:Myb-like DNA-binding domain-containing protein n=1 Tax=Diplodia corticola TaxID=236234 RepID=A0A1J9RJF0_9PEZI|nr:uncharacterized protein BKCO1_1000397 [Diplodia corticola]OJD40593.1 hypothetical protein BKCO1_1000397 [Diplodia corticola]
MPTDLENARLMLLCLQFSTATTFDYKKIGEECGISAGAASKRMSRLKKAIKEGKETNLDVRYLWSCIRLSDMDNVDFKAVGAELSLNPGAASKRWSRLKQALERGETGSTGPATGADVGKQGGARNGKKRQNAEIASDQEPDAANAKKAKSKPGTTRKTKVEEKIGNDDDGAAEPLREAVTTGAKNKKSTVDADTDVTRVTAETPKAKSAPRLRRPRPLTDEEIYKKLDVDEAEILEKRSMGPNPVRAYPKAHNLTDTFHALRTPDGKEVAPISGVFDNIISPGGAPAGGYPTPTDNRVLPSEQQQQNKPNSQEIFAEDAMMSPSGGGGSTADSTITADQQSSTKNSKSNGSVVGDDWFQVPQNLPNPFVDSGANGGGRAARVDYMSAFFLSNDDVPGDDEEYC